MMEPQATFRAKHACVSIGVAIALVAGDARWVPHSEAQSVFVGHREVPVPAPLYRKPPAEMPRTPARSVSFNGLTSVQVNVDVFGNDIIGDAANEPTIAIDPTDPNRIVIAWRQFDTIQSNFRQAGVAYSHDAGATWTNVGPLDPGQFRSDPVLGADNNGTFFLMSLSSGLSMELFRSFDGGLTWGSPIPAFGGDKDWMVVDTSGGPGDGNIYADWNPDISCCGTANFTWSRNGGASFGGPIDMPDPPLKFGMMAVGTDSELFLAGMTSDLLGQLFTRALHPYLPGPVSFDPMQSIDLGGATFVDSEWVNPVGLKGQVNIAVDHSTLSSRGNIYVLASVAPPTTDPLDVHFVRSVDNGETFSAPVRVNDDDPGNGAWQWLGTMSVAPNGRIDVVWLDTRNDATPATPVTSQLYYAYSLDTGYSWSTSIALSPSFNHTVGYPNQNKLGDYFHMISDAGGANLAYAATFSGGQDVYFLRIPADCNGNGIDDDDDVLVGGLADCNGNLVPDECEPMDDCNGNSTPDICDLAAGTGEDCNHNLILDECEGVTDCNGNGVADLCDIFTKVSADCNENNVPDECDISSGASADENGNGIPDECDAILLCTPGFSGPNTISGDGVGRNAVRAADLDGDGDLDVVASSLQNSNATWYENTDGAGTFGPAKIIAPFAYTPDTVAVGDIDGDDDLDVVVDGNADRTLVWYENSNGLGLFNGPHFVGDGENHVVSLRIADLDGDGDQDILSVSRLSESVAWYENVDGLGTFGPRNLILAASVVPYSAIAADVDGDGDLDVVVTLRQDNVVAWFDNVDGLGNFGAQQTLAVTNGPISVAAGDLDGDHDIDILSGSADGVAWHENTDGHGSFLTTHQISDPEYAFNVFLSDLDGDGDLDALAYFYTSGNVVWYENMDGRGHFGPGQIVSPHDQQLQDLVAADLGGNQEIDVLTASDGSAGLLWYRNGGPDCNQNGVTDSCDVTDGTSGDCNQNGIPDECDSPADCNGNLVQDVCDIGSGLSSDCNFDDVPDECQPAEDCNANGVSDLCDIGSGESLDCNRNDIPDECEIDTGALEDCNANSIPDICEPNEDCNGNGITDICELAAGTALDCNHNRRLDECDILNGDSEDADQDGVPDECGFAAPSPVVAASGPARPNRYLTVELPPSDGVSADTLEYLRVRVVMLDGYPVPERPLFYVGAPRQAPDERSDDPEQSFSVAPLMCYAFAYTWEDAGEVSIYAAEIIPGSTYEVQRAFATCPQLSNATCWSPAATITTAKFGDMVAPFAGGGTVQPDFGDISAIVSKFLAEPGAPSKAVAQLQPNIVYPDLPIDFNDISADVEAFLGATYASTQSGPCACPSAVPCDVITCAVDRDCAGLCIDGFCRDACGRCRP